MSVGGGGKLAVRVLRCFRKAAICEKVFFPSNVLTGSGNYTDPILNFSKQN